MDHRLKMIEGAAKAIPGCKETTKQCHTRFNHPGYDSATLFVSHSGVRIAVSIRHRKLIAVAHALLGEPNSDKNVNHPHLDVWSIA